MLRVLEMARDFLCRSIAPDDMYWHWTFMPLPKRLSLVLLTHPIILHPDQPQMQVETQTQENSPQVVVSVSQTP